MKLLIVSSHFPNIVGGVSDYVYHLSNALTEKGYEVYVLTSCDDRIIRDIQNNINVKILPKVKNWGIRGLIEVVKEIKQVNPDWVFLQYVPYMYSYYGIPVSIALLSILLRIIGFKFITTFHEVAIIFNFRKPKYWGIAALERLIAYIICMTSYKMIVSIEHYRKMLGMFSKKIYRIPIGSNIPPVEVSDNEKKELRGKLASSEGIIISTFGANPRRNDLLIAILKKLRDKKLPVKLLIIGKFPQDWVEVTKLEAKNLMVDNAIHFTGFLKSEDVYKYLSISDLFVILESIGNGKWSGVSTRSTSLAAAFAAGLTVIGNKGNMTDDFFIHGENIFLVDSLDEEAISEKIKELLTNPVLMKKLKKGATKTFETKLDWSVIAKKYIEVVYH